jgi:hypothetical protein
MESNRPYRIVIDTNVLFEGLTKQGGASGLINHRSLVSGLEDRVRVNGARRGV